MNDPLQNEMLDEDPGQGEEQAEEPSYLFGDVTADEAAEQFNYLRELPDSMRGLESRVQGAVSPAMEMLRSVQERLGTQPVFEPKLEGVQRVLQDYDPKLAEALLPALIEDLKGSMSMTPLGPEALEPHISPMLQEAQSRTEMLLAEQLIPTLLESLPFDVNTIVNRDGTDPDKVLAPQTDLQKDFAQWWEQADAPTREALTTVGFPYVQALQRFGKWRAERLRGKGEAAGAASARLTGASQRSTGGARTSSTPKLVTEEDGYKAYLASKRGANQ